MTTISRNAGTSRIIALWLPAVLLAAGLAGLAASAQEDGQAAGYCRLKSDQDLWSGPSRNFRVIKKAEAGSLLEILAQKGDFFRVRVPDGFCCYINAEFIAYGNDMVGTVTGSRVNLRSVPSLKGDYPILKIDRGATLNVWEREGEWVRVTAPPEAFAYVLKAAVVPVQSTPDLLREVETQRQKGYREWEDHVAGVSLGKVEVQKEAEIRSRFEELESAAASKYEGRDLEEVKSAYESVRAETSDELMRKVAGSRISEIDALLSQKKMQADLKELDRLAREREDKWREEMKRMEGGGGAGAAGAGVRDKPVVRPIAQGKRLVVLGRVDASGTAVLLRGGRFQDDPLYYIACPDRRYALKDFHGKRIAVKGNVEQMVTGELPRITVERVEILR